MTASARKAEPVGESLATESPTRSASHRMRAPPAIAASAATVCVAPADHPGEDELLAARVLLSAHGADGSHQRPGRCEDRGRSSHPPGRVAADAEKIVRHTVKQLHDLVRPKALREGQPVGRSRVSTPVADRVDEGDEEKEQCERARVDSPVRQRPPRERASCVHRLPVSS